MGLFAVNRRAGALWALADEPSAGHIVGRSRETAMVFFEEVLARRDIRADGTMSALAESSGYLADLSAHTVAPLGNGKAPGYPTAWLPSERAALAWKALVTESGK